MASFVERMIGAAKLDAKTYEEVEADKTATGQALGVVVLASLAAGVGFGGLLGFLAAGVAAVIALIGWFAWALLTYIIGAKIMPEPQTQADLGQLLRTIGFSSAPGVLNVVSIIPGIGGRLSFFVWVWMLVAMVVAVKQALDYQSTGRAVIVCLIGFAVYAVSMGVVIAAVLALIIGAAKG